MGKAITSVLQGIALLLMQNSLYGVHTVTRLLAQASALALERAKSEEPLKDNWQLIYY